MNFLRQIAICYEMIGMTNSSYTHILHDLINGKVTTYKEAAEKYNRGNEQSMYKTADRIKRDFYRDALDYDSYHNESQKILMEVRIKAASVQKLLYMGFRKLGIETALQTYKAASKYHIFDVAGEMACEISQHFGLYEGNEKKCKSWYAKYNKANRQRQITQETRFKFALATSGLRYSKTNSPKSIKYLKEVIDQLNIYSSDAESYVYWFYYYNLKICYHEARGEYDSMLQCATKGYNYFSKLPIDHKSSRLALVANVMHAHNLMGNYEEVLRFSSLVNGLKNAGTNRDLALLRLSRAYINLNQEQEAHNNLNQIDGSLKDVEEKIDLYKSYCTGEYPDKPQKDDPDGMDIAYKIANLYCDILKGVTDRYSHNYLLKYIRRHEIGETREGLMIKILSLMRHRGFDEKKFSRYYDLRLQLSATPACLTEVEVMQYELMLDKIDAIYS